MPEFLTDEEAALIWSGQTSSINQATETTPVVVDTTPAIETDDTKPAVIIDDKDLADVFVENPEDLEDDDDTTPVVDETKPPVETTVVDKKPGRKPTDLISLVSQLVEEEVLKPFEDGDIKTIEEAKELIKLNLQSKEEDSQDKWWETKLSKYSPQVQAILHYAEQGGTDIAPLLGMIAEVENTADLTLDTEAGQEEIVRQVLKAKNFDNDEIEDQISTLKDLEKLKGKAEKFLPELRNLNQQKLTRLMQEQDERKLEAQEATKVYLTTIQNTLSKDTVKGVKLQREDKAKIYDSLAAAKYTSLNGVPTNGFVKTLEELQFGKNADYEQFLNIVHFTVDPEGFLEKIRTSMKNEVNAETVKKLKSARTANANAEENFETRQPRKNTVARSTFKNPFS